MLTSEEERLNIRPTLTGDPVAVITIRGGRVSLSRLKSIILDTASFLRSPFRSYPPWGAIKPVEKGMKVWQKPAIGRVNSP